MASPWTWSVSARRYRNTANGRFIGVRQMRELRETFLRAQREETNALATRLSSGELTLQQWTLSMRQIVKNSHIDSAILARGGRRQMTQADWGTLGAQIRFQYQKLQEFAQDVAAGRLSEAEIRRRSRMYVDAARSSYHTGGQGAAREAGLDEERNVLHAAESCEGVRSCQGETRRGWVELGGLIPIGQRLCGPACQCEIIYRKSPTAVAWTM